MRYYSWFVSDENHKLYLRDMIRKVKPDYINVKDIILVAVASGYSDTVKDACWALEPDVKLIEYHLFKDTTGSIGIVPSIALDTSIGERVLER